MTKGGIAEALSTNTNVWTHLNSLAEIATQEVKSTGVFTILGVCKIKTRVKPATKAGKREVFGKVVMVKAKPASKLPHANVEAWGTSATVEHIDKMPGQKQMTNTQDSATLSALTPSYSA